MKKTLYLTIITVITVICIILGSCFHLIGWGFDILNHAFSNDATEDSMTIEQQSNLDEFHSIQVHLHVSDFTIETGDSYQLHYTCSEKLKPTYKVEDDTLVITQPEKKNLFGMNHHSEITLTVPQNADFKSCNITSSVGDINLNNLTCDTTTIDSSVGDIKIRQCDLGNGNLSSSTGDIETDSIKFSDLDIDSSVGDVDIAASQDLSSYNIDLNTSVGDIRYNGAKQGKDFHITGSGSTLTISNSTGDIKVSDNQ